MRNIVNELVDIDDLRNVSQISKINQSIGIKLGINLNNCSIKEFDHAVSVISSIPFHLYSIIKCAEFFLEMDKYSDKIIKISGREDYMKTKRKQKQTEEDNIERQLQSWYLFEFTMIDRDKIDGIRQGRQEHQ